MRYGIPKYSVWMALVDPFATASVPGSGLSMFTIALHKHMVSDSLNRESDIRAVYVSHGADTVPNKNVG
jgi:hypothetical protein